MHKQEVTGGNNVNHKSLFDSITVETRNKEKMGIWDYFGKFEKMFKTTLLMYNLKQKQPWAVKKGHCQAK